MDLNPDSIKKKILENAAEIKRLHERVHETFKFREQSQLKRREWELACREFHARYDVLVFPGGYSGAAERILAGDAEAVEAALCFVECRPYFFRSGYMFETLLRKLNRAPLSITQRARFQQIIERLAEWKKKKRSAK